MQRWHRSWAAGHGEKYRERRTASFHKNIKLKIEGQVVAPHVVSRDLRSARAGECTPGLLHRGILRIRSANETSGEGEVSANLASACREHTTLDVRRDLRVLSR